MKSAYEILEQIDDVGNPRKMNLDEWIEFLCELHEGIEERLNAAREDSAAQKR